MNLNVALSYCSFLLVLALLIVFLPKVQVKSVRTKLYAISVALAGVFVLSDISNIMIHTYCNITFINELVWMLHWLICCLAVYFFSLKILNMAYNMKVEKVIDIIKYNFITKFELILLILLQVVYVIFFFNKDFDINNINFMTTPVLLIVGVYVFTLGFIYLYILFKNKENTTKNEKLSVIYQMFIMTLGVILQYFLPNFSLIPTTMVLTGYCSYFLGDNPDILLLRDIKIMKSSIDESNKVKTNFLSNMTDEIKDPVDIILNLSKELIATPIEEKEKIIDIANQIKNSGQNTLDIINNVLDACVIEGSNTRLQEKKYKVKDLLNDLIDATKVKLGSKPVRLIITADENISSVLLGDYSKIYQSLLNILINSVEKTDVGRINFTITSSKKNGIEEVLFKITDTGSGMSIEEQKKVFTKKENDSGLGLEISKNYIETMEGKIWFETQYRVGTSFYVQINQKIIDSTPMGKILEEVEEKTLSYIDCTGKKVLIVDDNELNIKVTKKYLERYNFEIESALSGEECICNIKGEKEYDLILTDYVMPDMNGTELLSSLRALDGYRIPPIVILTANAITGVKEEYIKIGFNDYLAKPINSQELDRIVKELFKK